MRGFRYCFHIIVLMSALVTTGCTITQYMADSSVPWLKKLDDAMKRNTNVDLVGDAMPGILVQLDGMVEASPENHRLLVRAAEGYNRYSYVFIEDYDKERAGELYYKSFQYTLRVLNQEKEFQKALGGTNGKFKKSLKEFLPRDVPALFWASNSWLSLVLLYAEKPDIPSALPKIKAMLKSCIELDESYMYGAAHALMGVLLISESETQSVNHNATKSEFERSFEISDNKILLFHLLYAKYYAAQIQDRALYVGTLLKIIAAPDDLSPEMAFLNSAAKRKANKMLNNVNNVFKVK